MQLRVNVHCVCIYTYMVIDLKVQFPVWWGFWTITLPFVGSSRASKGEASGQPDTMVLKHLPLSLPNDAFWSLKKQAPDAAAKFPKARLCESQAPRHLVFAFPSIRPCWWPGFVNRDIFAKVSPKFCEGAGKSQSACWRGWVSKPCPKKLINNNLSWEGIPCC